MDLNTLVFEYIEKDLFDRIYFKAGQSVLGSGDLTLIDDAMYSYMTQNIIISQIIYPCFREYFMRFPLYTDFESTLVHINAIEIDSPEVLKPWLIGVGSLTTGNSFFMQPGYGYFANFYQNAGYPFPAGTAISSIQNMMSTAELQGSLQPFVTANFNPITYKLILKSTTVQTFVEYNWAFYSYNTDYIKVSRKQEFWDFCANSFLIQLIDLRTTTEDDSSVRFTMETIRTEAKEKNDKILENWDANSDSVYVRL